ncbi:MAG TPA: M56 family metallopeptidase [Mucilaginibacter sp.]|nr:M56 family metallopeptidase [Mucilaginibacter sp.]
MNWLQYLLEANLYLGIFYLVYCLFLNKETYYLFNRAYLLFSCVISFILPLVQLGFLRPDEQKAQTVSYVIAAHGFNNLAKTEVANPYFTLQNCLLGVYLLGAIIFIILLIIKLNRLFSLTRNTSDTIDNRYKLVHINDSNSAFSFFNYLFIGTKAMDAEIIIRHELVHIRQKHSFDIILLELVKIINWFNPLVYLLQNSLKTVHEYIADEQTASYKTDPLTYSAFLVNNAYGIGGPSITHSFFNYNLLKKRIIMLNQKRSGSLARLKYLLTVPVCAGLLCVSTLGFSKTYGFIDLLPQKADTAYVAPPPPPEPPELKHVVKFKTPTPPFGTITKKGYRYAESGYLVNGKSYYRVIIQESKNVQKEYWKNKVSAADIKMLHDKYGYTFPTMPIYPKLPPPPPLPPTGKPVKPIPPVKADVTIIEPVSPVKPKSPLLLTVKPAKPAPPIKADVRIDEPVSPQQVKSPPPPMEPYKPLTNVFAALDKYIAVHTRFPAVALENKVTGSVIATFELNADHKITNVKLISGIGNKCDEEAMRVLNNFTDPIDAKPGTYKLAVTFILNGLAAPKPASEALSNDPSFIGEVVLEGYLK